MMMKVFILKTALADIFGQLRVVKFVIFQNRGNPSKIVANSKLIVIDACIVAKIHR